MSAEQFIAMMPYITDDLAAMIAKRQSISEEEAVLKLFGSRLYAQMEKEETKVWQYSTDMLYSLFEKEQETGVLSFPDV